MGYNVCKLCNCNIASKKNSHIIPSFLIAMVTSWDQSYKRDKEVLFTMHGLKRKLYIGELPDTKINELFESDKLTDERIEKELKNNTATENYIFCPKCEYNIAKYLEGPYATNMKANKTIPGDVSIFFWLSVIWRMSFDGNYGFKLNKGLENCMGKLLKDYLTSKEAKKDNIIKLIEAIPFSYKIIWCDSYCKYNSGFIFAKLFQDNNILLLIIGDGIISINLNQNSFPQDINFIGCGKYFKEAFVNYGLDIEKKLNICKEDYNSIMKNFVEFASNQAVDLWSTKLDLIWQNLGFEGNMPFKMKKDIITGIHDEDTKIGDKYTNEHILKTIVNVLKEYGFHVIE